MKLISSVPIIAANIFIYELDSNNNFINDFKSSEFTLTPNNNKAYQSNDKSILNKFPILEQQIKSAVKDVILDKFKYTNDFIITRSWLTKTEPQGSSDDHFHSNNWLSGIYYPDYDPSFQITFYNDYRDAFVSEPTEFNIYNSLNWTITPKKNSLIIFSSRLRHEVLINTSDRDRYSLAFNLLPNGIFGNEDSKVDFNFK